MIDLTCPKCLWLAYACSKHAPIEHYPAHKDTQISIDTEREGITIECLASEAVEYLNKIYNLS